MYRIPNILGLVFQMYNLTSGLMDKWFIEEILLRSIKKTEQRARKEKGGKSGREGEISHRTAAHCAQAFLTELGFSN